ncbi:hypothetical protein GGI06_005030 [Coemansia sp. S85]|nr:hypothetical protein GGI06_005030 [Coemansia sp. S85]
MPSFGTLSDSDLELLAHIPSDLPNVTLPDLLTTMSNILSSLGHGIDESTTKSIIEPASKSAVEEPAVRSAVEANGTGDETTDGSGLETNEDSNDENWSLFNGESGVPRQSVLARLGLESDANRAVLAPVLFCIMASLCSVPVDDVSDPLLERSFEKATELNLESLRVLSRHGVQTMTSAELCARFKQWVNGLGALVNKGSVIDDLLGWAETSNNLYTCACGKDATKPTSDLNERVAQRVLADNEHKGSLFLGLSAADIRELYEHLGFGVDNNANDSAETA